MFYGDTIQETRQIFFSSWKQYKEKQPLSPLAQQVVQVILEHPEYQHAVEQLSTYQQHTYYPELGESNPFLHMGLHLAIREQIATNRPNGITMVFQKLVQKNSGPLEVEHQMMEQLAEFLWLAQKNNLPPDEQQYLDTLRVLCEN